MLIYVKFAKIKLFKKRNFNMAKKGARETIKLKSTESKECYWTTKNKKNTTDRLEVKKYDRRLRKHVLFKESK